MTTTTETTLTSLPRDVADAAVAGILRTAYWRTRQEPLTPHNTHDSGIVPEAGWTYLRTENLSSGWSAVVRGRLMSHVNDVGDPELAAEWELVGVWDALGLPAVAPSKTRGVVGFPVPTSAVTIN